MKKSRRNRLFSALAGVTIVLGASALPANATTTFDAETGKGFAGKGDVQFAFGWSNQQLQANAAATTFQVVSQTNYEYVCEYWFENNKFQEFRTAEKVQNRNVSDGIAYDKRIKTQITGFNLQKYSGTGSYTGTEIVLGQPCDAAGTTGTVIGVTKSSDTKLQVVYGGLGVIIWRNGVSVLP